MASGVAPLLVVCTGPECTGKTSLAERLAAHFESPVIDEAARHYLQHNRHQHLQHRQGQQKPHAYQPSDLLNISRQQQLAEHQGRFNAAQQSAPLLFADTDLQVIYIWWQEKFGPAPRLLLNQYASQSPRHYLLCQPDLPWQPDPQRENPLDRQRLFEHYHRDLQARHARFDVIDGQSEQRWQNALAAVQRLVSSSV